MHTRFIACIPINYKCIIYDIGPSAVALRFSRINRSSQGGDLRSTHKLPLSLSDVLQVTAEISQVNFEGDFGPDVDSFRLNLYIRMLPGSSPRLLPGVYPYLSEMLHDLYWKTYQKHNRNKSIKPCKT